MLKDEYYKIGSLCLWSHSHVKLFTEQKFYFEMLARIVT